jgi:hypothetical protein
MTNLLMMRGVWKCFHTEWMNVIMMSVIMMNGIMMNVIMMNIIMIHHKMNVRTLYY